MTDENEEYRIAQKEYTEAFKKFIAARDALHQAGGKLDAALMKIVNGRHQEVEHAVER